MGPGDDIGPPPSPKGVGVARRVGVVNMAVTGLGLVTNSFVFC